MGKKFEALPLVLKILVDVGSMLTGGVAATVLFYWLFFK